MWMWDVGSATWDVGHGGELRLQLTKVMGLHARQLQKQEKRKRTGHVCESG